MTEEATNPSLLDRIRWWAYGRCFAYCVRMVHPDASPDEFCLLDMTAFIAVDKDEIREIIEEAPEQAWRFEAKL